MRYVFLLLLLSACGAPHYAVPSEFQPYVSSFKAAYGKNFDNIEYEIGDLPEGVIGQCAQGGGSGTVTVSPSYWSTMSDEQKEETIFHELGHCVLRRAHDSKADNLGRPLSIMNPYGFGGWWYSSNRDTLVDELFHGNGPMLSVGIMQDTPSDIEGNL